MDDIFKNRLRGGYSNQKAQSSGAVGKAVQSQKTQPFLVWVPTVSVGTHTGFSTQVYPLMQRSYALLCCMETRKSCLVRFRKRCAKQANACVGSIRFDRCHVVLVEVIQMQQHVVVRDIAVADQITPLRQISRPEECVTINCGFPRNTYHFDIVGA